jgi:hypothetical protein
MRLRCGTVVLTAVLSLLVFVSAAPAAPPAAATSPSLSIPIVGTTGTGAVFNGTFTPTSFVLQNGQLTAVGTLAGTLTDALGAVIGTVNQTISAAVTATGTCSVLHLTIGPVDLNLLGLNVHLDQVTLDISATAGPGNLVGNLVCAVAHLLDNPSGLLTGVTNLLNQILARL